MKSWIRRLLVVLALLLVAGGALLYLAANVFFQPERLVRKLEEKLNCRASIESVDLSLFSQPARLELQKLVLAHRDRHADEQTPIADRPPITEPEISAEKLSLSVSFPHLLIGKIHVHELVATDLTGKLTKPAEGDHSLDRLFDDPDEDEDDDEKDGSKKDDDEEDDDDTIDRLKLPATLRSARLENASFVIALEKKDTRITWSDIHLDLANVDIAPSDLVNRNHADIDVRARVLFDHLVTGRSYGNMVLEGNGAIRPVDPETRKLKPALDFEIHVLPGTRLETAPLLEAVSDKLEDLEKYGIQLADLQLGGNLTKEALLKGSYRDHQFSLAADTVFDFRDYGFALEEGSWYESEDNGHEFKTRLTAGAVITDNILSGIDRYVRRKVKFLPSDTFRRLVGDHFLKDGRFTLRLVTKGDIGRPRVAFSEKLPDIDVNAVKDQAEDLIKDLKSLFD